MYLLRYFKLKEQQAPSHPLLPKPRSSTESSANAVSYLDAVERKPRGVYKHYDATLRAKIGRYSYENGNKAAANYYSTKLGWQYLKVLCAG